MKWIFSFPKRLFHSGKPLFDYAEVIKICVIGDYTITITLSDGDFVESMGRMPENQEEFEQWAVLAEKGLLNGHIDWNIIYECTKEPMPSSKGDKDEYG